MNKTFIILIYLELLFDAYSYYLLFYKYFLVLILKIFNHK